MKPMNAGALRGGGKGGASPQKGGAKGTPLLGADGTDGASPQRWYFGGDPLPPAPICDDVSLLPAPLQPPAVNGPADCAPTLFSSLFSRAAPVAQMVDEAPLSARAGGTGGRPFPHDDFTTLIGQKNAHAKGGNNASNNTNKNSTAAAASADSTAHQQQQQQRTVLDEAPYVDTLRDTLFPAVALALEHLLVTATRSQIALERDRVVKGVPDPIAAALRAVRPAAYAAAGGAASGANGGNSSLSSVPALNRGGNGSGGRLSHTAAAGGGSTTPRGGVSVGSRTARGGGDSAMNTPRAGTPTLGSGTNPSSLAGTQNGASTSASAAGAAASQVPASSAAAAAVPTASSAGGSHDVSLGETVGPSAAPSASGQQMAAPSTAAAGRTLSANNPHNRSNLTPTLSTNHHPASSGGGRRRRRNNRFSRSPPRNGARGDEDNGDGSEGYGSGDGGGHLAIDSARPSNGNSPTNFQQQQEGEAAPLGSLSATTNGPFGAGAGAGAGGSPSPEGAESTSFLSTSAATTSMEGLLSVSGTSRGGGGGGANNSRMKRLASSKVAGSMLLHRNSRLDLRGFGALKGGAGGEGGGGSDASSSQAAADAATAAAAAAAAAAAQPSPAKSAEQRLGWADHSQGLPQFNVPGNSRRAPHDGQRQRKALAAAAASYFNVKRTFPQGPIETFLKYKNPLDLIDPAVIADRANANVFRSAGGGGQRPQGQGQQQGGAGASNSGGSAAATSSSAAAATAAISGTPSRRASMQAAGIGAASSAAELRGLGLGAGMMQSASLEAIAAVAAAQNPISVRDAVHFFATELKRIGAELKAERRKKELAEEEEQRRAAAEAAAAAAEASSEVSGGGKEAGRSGRASGNVTASPSVSAGGRRTPAPIG